MAEQKEPTGAAATEEPVTEFVSEGHDHDHDGDHEHDHGDAPEHKLALDVQIEKAGPCRKHVRVRVPRKDIEHFYEDALGELSGTAAVPGFRVGHVPRKLLEKRFRKEIGGQVKQKVLVASLQQVEDEHNLQPINEPDIDIETLEIPEQGDFAYEFDVEVRPEFDLPDYRGMKIERPNRETTDEDVTAYLRRFQSEYGEWETVDGPAEEGDAVQCAVEFRHGERPLRKLDHVTLQLKPVLRFQDAELQGFDDLMRGAKAGDVREADLTVSQEAATIEMRGEPVHATFRVAEVRRMRLPEMNSEFLERIGVESEEELRQQIRNILERQVKFQQRQEIRQQVLGKITESADWDLPDDLVRRQTENAIHREVLEMQQAGFTVRDIRARENEIRQRALSTTRQALKEHFVLDKIATTETIEVSEQDIDTEIAMMAMSRGESPRRLRARLVKSGVIENLEAQIRERKAVDCVLDKAEFVDVEMKPLTDDRVEAVPHAVCGVDVVAPETGEEE